jgi:hypothetical protein
MQRLEVSGAVRPIYGSLGVKRLIVFAEKRKLRSFFFNFYSRHPIMVTYVKSELQDSWIRQHSKICI